MQSQTCPICNGKPRGIFINTQKANCSIYESGVMVYQCLKLSERYSLDYTEIDPKNLSLRPYDFYFFNYHHATMKFLNTASLRQLSGLTVTMILETLTNNPFPLCPAADFDIYCALDPTMNIPDRRVYAFPRPLEVAQRLLPYQEKNIPVIGSFGFGTPGKGFELVVDAVNKEFDKAVVRINIPCSTHADDVTFKLFKQKYSDYLRDLCTRVARPGIQVVITNDFMGKSELIDWCGQNTLNCFFYDRNQPGLSATTDQAITSERPLLVSANETFRHIHPYIKPYPYMSIREAINRSLPGVLKMKTDWHPRKFAEKFETVLEDCNLLAKTNSGTEKIVVNSERKKDTILIISHKKKRCGVYQYGIDIVSALSKSNVYNFVRVECFSHAELDDAIRKYNPKVIIYNYYPFSWPWLNAQITRSYRIPQLCVMHEVTQEAADKATTEMFDGFLCPDPTLVKNQSIIYKTPRLIPTYCNYSNIPDVLTIGSFGFGFCDKGFERLIDIAQKEFDRVNIRIHMPFNSIVDDHGEVHALNTAQRCRDTLKKNTNVDLQINHSYLTKEELLKFLAGNTINAFFYNVDKRLGISSVIDSALAVRRPIAITKCGMFRHVVNASPSICIEDSNFKTIISNGIAPLVPFYNDWSEAAFIKRYEDIMNNVLGKSREDGTQIDIRENVPGACKDSVVAIERQETMNDRNGLLQETERLIQAKDITQARAILHGILQRDSQDVLCLIDLSVCDMLEGKNTDALKKLNVVLSIEPNNKIAKANLQHILGQNTSCRNETNSSHPIRPVTNVQIELAGYCSANCEFCDWVRRPKEQMILMDTALAKKCVREGRELKAKQISFHLTGEALLHPDILDILPRDYPILISTNCLQLEGPLARELAQMKNLVIILAVLWSEPERKRLTSIVNALSYLHMNPVNRQILVQIVCSESAIPWAPFMYHYFSPFLDKLPALQLHFKQPYTREANNPILGYIPEGIPESPRVQVDRMPTPQGAGPDCVAFSPNPATDICIQSDGQIMPCYYRWPHWNLGNAKTTSLREAWTSRRYREIQYLWSIGDPDNKLACHHCIRLAVPRGEKVWWWGPGGTNVPPSVFTDEQAKRTDSKNPYPKIYLEDKEVQSVCKCSL
jgi:radical SAM protein with 4Fe4S-binding SPASM domain